MPHVFPHTYLHLYVSVYLLVSVMLLRTPSSSVMSPALQLPGSELADTVNITALVCGSVCIT